MALRFSELIQKPELQIRNVERLRSLYHLVQNAITEGFIQKQSDGEKRTINELIDSLNHRLQEQRVEKPREGGQDSIYDYLLKEDEGLDTFVHAWIADAGITKPSVGYDARGKTNEPLYNELSKAYALIENENATAEELRSSLYRLLVTVQACRPYIDRLPPVERKLSDDHVQEFPLPEAEPEGLDYDHNTLRYIPGKGFEVVSKPPPLLDTESFEP